MSLDRLTSDERLSRTVSHWFWALCLRCVSFLSISGLVWDNYSDSIGEWLRLHYQSRVEPPLPALPPEVLAALPPIEIVEPKFRSNQIIEGVTRALSPLTHWTGLLTMIVFAALLRLKATTHAVWGLWSFILELHWFGAISSP